MDDVAAWFRWLHQATGIKLTIFYDSYDRSRFLQKLDELVQAIRREHPVARA